MIQTRKASDPPVATCRFIHEKVLAPRWLLKISTVFQLQWADTGTHANPLTYTRGVDETGCSLQLVQLLAIAAVGTASAAAACKLPHGVSSY